MPKWLKRTILTIVSVIVLLFVVAVGLLLYYNIPSNGAGMAAKAVCSATFVAGRDNGQDVFAEDVLPASPAFKAISTNVNQQEKSVTGKFLGMFERRASLLPDRGCVLDEPPDPAAQPYVPPPPNPAPWPQGDAALTQNQWPAGVNAERLQKVVEQAFVGAGDTNAANARGVAIVQDGKLLARKEAAGFPEGTALHGWSMTKTVAGMLAFKKFQEMGLEVKTPVVDAFPPGRAPEWVAEWRGDDRAKITIADLMYMKAGLDLSEGYAPWDPVVQMLNSEPNMAGWAANHKLVHPPGTYFEYSSAVANILAEVAQGQFPDNREYWSYPYRELFDKIGADSATLETDTFGTWVGSSYLWASVGDWARLGQVMLDDGRWKGEQVLPAEWLRLAATPGLPEGDGAGYGAQTWIPANPVGGECKGTPGLPEDTLMMEGHWGQVVAMIPSKRAVIVRLGWTTTSGQFNGCQFIADAAGALGK